MAHFRLSGYTCWAVRALSGPSQAARLQRLAGMSLWWGRPSTGYFQWGQWYWDSSAVCLVERDRSQSSTTTWTRQEHSANKIKCFWAIIILSSCFFPPHSVHFIYIYEHLAACSPKQGKSSEQLWDGNARFSEQHLRTQIGKSAAIPNVQYVNKLLLYILITLCELRVNPPNSKSFLSYLIWMVKRNIKRLM